ncbi:hypothetical protein LCGC14_2499780 [marine sediment metagenome]|uniref:Uncharacterized protein n=1 Tax=marine sediment metagenome TaxID=412755 RepID=A0A0F9BQA1_9ZZZZ
MAENGVSKKLFMGTMIVQGVFVMAKDAPPEQRFWYAIVAASVGIVFQGLQFVIDWKKNKG